MQKYFRRAEQATRKAGLKGFSTFELKCRADLDLVIVQMKKDSDDRHLFVTMSHKKPKESCILYGDLADVAGSFPFGLVPTPKDRKKPYSQIYVPPANKL